MGGKQGRMARKKGAKSDKQAGIVDKQDGTADTLCRMQANEQLVDHDHSLDHSDQRGGRGDQQDGVQVERHAEIEVDGRSGMDDKQGGMKDRMTNGKDGMTDKQGIMTETPQVANKTDARRVPMMQLGIMIRQNAVGQRYEAKDSSSRETDDAKRIDSAAQPSGLEIDCSKPLSDILQSAFSNNYGIIITLPPTSISHIKGDLHNIRRLVHRMDDNPENAQFTTAGKEIGAQQIKTYVQKPDQITEIQQREQMMTCDHEKERNASKLQRMASEEYHTSNYTLDVRLVLLCYQDISNLKCEIINLMINAQRPLQPVNNAVRIVTLEASSSQEFLAVEPDDEYRVHFKTGSTSHDATSLFVRVKFSEDEDSETDIVFINLCTLEPITRDDENNDLHARRQGSRLQSFTDILQNPSMYHCSKVFSEHGGGDRRISIRLQREDPNRWISKDVQDAQGAQDIAKAVIRDTSIDFNVLEHSLYLNTECEAASS